MNIELLEKVKERIRNEPTHFDMADWFRNNPDNMRARAQDGFGGCGTAACIAGWCCIAAHKGNEKDLGDIINALILGAGNGSAEYRATQLLDITPGQAHCLFYSNKWPNPFYREYTEAQTGCPTTGRRDFARQAEITCRRIDFFIKEGR